MPKYLNEITMMPQMSQAFLGWSTKVTLLKVTQTVALGDVTNSLDEISFIGVVQPLGAKQIALKPEGQRAWQWLQIHCVSSDLDLDVNDRIQFCNKIYKVMAKNDYSLNNYIEYHAVEDFENE